MKLEQINGSNYLSFPNIEEEETEEFEVEILEQNAIPGLLPFRMEQENHQKTFLYSVGNEISLSEWKEEFHSENEILDVWKSIAEACIETESWLLDSEKLCLTMETVFVEKTAPVCKAVYLPVKGSTETGLKNLLKEWIEMIPYSRMAYFTVLFDMMNAYSRSVIRTEEDLLRWVTEKLNHCRKDSEEIAPAISEQNQQESIQQVSNLAAAVQCSTTQKEMAQDQQKDSGKKSFFHKADKKEKEKPEKGKAEKGKELPLPGELSLPEGFAVLENAGIPEEKNVEKEAPKRPIFSFGNRKREKEEQPDMVMPVTPKRETSAYVERDTSDTVFVEDVVEKTKKTAQLQNRQNGQIYMLAPKVTVIGTSKGNADICLDECRVVSRRHARISCEQEQYYLEDLGSKNGTYVNGTELEASTPVLLKDKTVIRFANQEFLFLLEK